MPSSGNDLRVFGLDDALHAVDERGGSDIRPAAAFAGIGPVVPALISYVRALERVG